MFIFLNMKDDFRSARYFTAFLLLHLHKLMNLSVHPLLSMKCVITGEFFSSSIKQSTSIAVTRIAPSNSFSNGIMQISIVFCTVNRCRLEFILNVFLAPQETIECRGIIHALSTKFCGY